MPLFSLSTLNNSILIKKLQTTQKNLYVQHNKEVTVNTETTTQKRKYTDDKINFNENSSNRYSENIIYQKNPDGFASKPNKSIDNLISINKEVIENIDLFKYLITNPGCQGIIYSDNNIKIEIKAKLVEKNCFGIIFSFLGNHSKAEDIFLTHTCDSSAININLSQVRNNNEGIPQAYLKAYVTNSFSNPPIISLKARVGMMNVTCRFAIPVLITKFLSPYKIGIENYSMKWFNMSNEADRVYHKLDCILQNPSHGKIGVMDFLKKLGALFVNLNFNVYPPVDLTNFHDLEAAAMIEYKEGADPIIVLLQASFIPSYSDEFRLSVRAHVPCSGYENLTLDIISVIKFYVNP